MTYQPRKPFRKQALRRFKPMTNYSTGFEISKEKAYEILKARANGMLKHKVYNILAGSHWIQTHNLRQINFFFIKYQKEKALKIRR